MIVYAVFVIDEAGRTILSEKFQSAGNIADEVFLGGIINSLQTVSNEMIKNKSELKSIELEGFSFHIRSFGLIRIIVVTDIPKNPQELIQILGFRFIKEYGEPLLSIDRESNISNPFTETIHEVLSENIILDDSKSIPPSLKLSTGDIFNLPHYLQAIALAIVSLQEGTLEEIVIESGENLEIAKKSLLTLQQLGYIGISQRDGIKRYYCSL
jgi:hypothetical protein